MHSVNLKAHFTDPNGNEFLTIYNAEKESCTNFTVSTPNTDVSGVWSVYVTVLWMEDETLYETTSNQISFQVKEPIFRGTIEKISVPKAWHNVYTQDWSADGKSILMTYYQTVDADSILPRIAVMSTDNFDIVTLDIPMLLETDEQIGLAKFSPDGKFIHFVADDGNLFRYDLGTSETLKLTHFSEWIHFDYYHYYEKEPEMYSIVISLDRESYYDDPSEQGFILLDIGNGEENSVENTHELISGDELHRFDISPDGKKILFHKTIESSYGWADRVLAYYTPEGNVVEIPNNQLNCGSPSKWAPNGEMIIFNVSSCGRGALGSTLHLISIDGAYHELVLPYDNNNPDSFVISPDGTSLFYLKHPDFEMMTLAKPIPEFETITMMIMMLSVLPIILLRKQMMFK
ncbi:hypothetical protein [Nitrosopumilus sp.]|uniref:hypothetical protein n=1 Tax=Nitrosopumilus sp. TaxID=2024843 RepID=UPI003B5A050C